MLRVKVANLLPCPDAKCSADCATPELAYRVVSIASVIHCVVVDGVYVIVRTSLIEAGFCKLT